MNAIWLWGSRILQAFITGVAYCSKIFRGIISALGQTFFAFVAKSANIFYVAGPRAAMK
jgi:hypothetical protein